MSEPYNKQLDRIIIQRFEDEVKPSQYELSEVAAWAIQEGLWEPPMKSKISQLTKELSSAMRAKTFTDSEGRQVRSNHCVRRTITTEEGKTLTQAVWANIDVATHPFMEESFRQRRETLVGGCFKLEVDRQYWNKEKRQSNPQIELPLDFTDDVADRMESTDYDPNDFDD